MFFSGNVGESAGLRNGVKSLRSYAKRPLFGAQRAKQDGSGVAGGIKMVHVSFADFSSRSPKKYFAKIAPPFFFLLDSTYGHQMTIGYITYRDLSKDDLAVMSLLDKVHLRRLYIEARM